MECYLATWAKTAEKDLWNITAAAPKESYMTMIDLHCSQIKFFLKKFFVIKRYTTAEAVKKVSSDNEKQQTQ